MEASSDDPELPITLSAEVFHLQTDYLNTCYDDVRAADPAATWCHGEAHAHLWSSQDDGTGNHVLFRHDSIELTSKFMLESCQLADELVISEFDGTSVNVLQHGAVPDDGSLTLEQHRQAAGGGGGAPAPESVDFEY